jgi:4-hydroxy-tetrahydrodipicolinate synthase
MFNFSGTGVALITPFNNNLSIDFESLNNLIEHVILGGVDFLVILGTTAETTSLSNKEKTDIIDFIVKINAKRIPLVIRIGGNNTNKVKQEILSTNLLDFDAILSVTPYYNKPSQEGLYRHYREISKISPLPVILYNVPSRTGVNMNYETTLRLANDFTNIVAIKEASGDIQQIKNILSNKPSNFNVLSGDDASTLEMIYLGATGVISVIGQSHPKEFSEMVDAGLKNDKSKANKIHDDLFKFYHFLYSEGNPSGIKGLLYTMNICKNILRLPLTIINKSLLHELKLIINK